MFIFLVPKLPLGNRLKPAYVPKQELGNEVKKSNCKNKERTTAHHEDYANLKQIRCEHNICTIFAYSKKYAENLSEPGFQGFWGLMG